MTNLVMPNDKIPIADTFSMYVTVASENGTSENYSPEDITGIKNASLMLSSAIEKLDEFRPSDRNHEANKIKDATRNMMNDFNKHLDTHYNALLAEQTQALFKPCCDVAKVVGAQELRDSFKEFAGDGPLITMFALKLNDQQFDVLRFSQPTPIVRKDSSGIVTSVELAPMVPIEIERAELSRRRPDIATRLQIFEFRKDAGRGLSKTLSDLVFQRLDSY